MTRTHVEPSGVPKRKIANGVWTCGRFTLRRVDVPGKSMWWWEIFLGEERAVLEQFGSLTTAHLWCRKNDP